MKRAVLIILVFLFLAVNVHGEEDVAGIIEKQRIELKQKEETVKKETERLNTLKKEVENDIVKYTALLEQIDKSLKQAEEIGSKRLRHVAKAYEAMQPEDAASRLSGLDNDTAVQILLKMESKKAGLVIGIMGPQKATLLTKEITKLKM
jgi:flagellar motility protein MotE (MotC chaperone)